MTRKVKNTITNQKDQKDLLMLVARIKQTFQKVFDEDKYLTEKHVCYSVTRVLQ